MGSGFALTCQLYGVSHVEEKRCVVKKPLVPIKAA